MREVNFSLSQSKTIHLQIPPVYMCDLGRPRPLPLPLRRAEPLEDDEELVPDDLLCRPLSSSTTRGPLLRLDLRLIPPLKVNVLVTMPCCCCCCDVLEEVLLLLDDSVVRVTVVVVGVVVVVVAVPGIH